MAETLNLGNGNWAVKKDSLLAYNSENGNFKPLPFDFTRASSATVVNKDGLIEIVGSGKPRIDFKDDAKGALLLEPQRSNLILRSEEFESVSWTKSNSLITSNSVISPNGTLNADKLVESNFNGDHYVSSQIISVSSGQITNTIWLKSAERTQAVIFEQVSVKGIYVDLESGTFIKNLVNTPDSYSIFKDSNGWVKVSITTTNSSTSRLRIYPSKNGSVSYQGDGASGVYIFGAQLEQGSYATSYIPTQGGTVTRVAETAIDGGAEAPIFSNTSAVWFIDFSRFGYDSSINSAAITLNNSSNVEQIRFHFDQPTQTVRFRDAKNSFSNIGVSINTFSNIRKKVALKIDGTTLKVFSDGQQIGSDYTRPNAFDINSMDLQSSAFNLFETKFYNTTLSDAELQALTTL